MNAASPSDDLVLRIDVSRFRDARDVLPRPATVTYGELEALVAPERPPVREDLIAKETKRLRLIDEAEHTVLDGCRPSRWLADHPTFRALERAAWTAEAGEGARARAVRDAAQHAREATTRRTKTHLPCWSPVLCHRHATRGIPAVATVTCLVLDYDDGTALDEALEPWLDWPLLAASTWSHTEASPRFRITLVLSRPVPADAWPQAWAWAAGRAAGTVDPACKDPSRLYLLPALRSAHAPYERRVHDPGGHLLDLDWERFTGGPAPRAPSSPPSTPVPSRRRQNRPPTDPARRAARELFKRDEAARRRAAHYLEADLAPRRAQRIPCPACGRSSVWFWLTPGPQTTAQCHHKRSCGWWGHLDELLDARGGSHVG